MYDTIKVEYPLPFTPSLLASTEFQTKSLDCNIDEYLISSGGLLIKLVKEDYDNPSIVTSNYVCTSFSGPLNFYGFLGCNYGFSNCKRDLVEFEATVLKGHVIAMEKVDNSQ